MKKVAVVVLNFKVKELILKCVESVRKSSYPADLLVVDNNSGDGLEEEVKKIPGVEFIQTGHNLGYTGGNNVGIKKALEDGADYIFILNPDTIIDKDCIKNLLRGMDETDSVVAGPKILFGDRKTIWYAGGIFDKLNVLGRHRGVDEKDQGQFDENSPTDFVSGAAMMVKKEAFGAVGLFDDRYFLYYEDADLCYRMKMAGFKIMYIGSSLVYHENAKSTGLGSPLQDYFITRNRFVFASKFLSLRTRFALFREAIRNIGNPMRRLALWDFLTGNFGKGSFT